MVCKNEDGDEEEEVDVEGIFFLIMDMSIFFLLDEEVGDILWEFSFGVSVGFGFKGVMMNNLSIVILLGYEN